MKVHELIAALQALPNEDAELVLSHTKDKISINVLRGFPTDAWAVLDVSVLYTKEPIEKVLHLTKFVLDAECKTPVECKYGHKMECWKREGEGVTT